MTKAVTITLDDAQAAELERIALAEDLSVDEAMGVAVELFILDRSVERPPLTEEEKAAIERGLEDARAGRVTSHEDLVQELEERFGTREP